MEVDQKLLSNLIQNYILFVNRRKKYVNDIDNDIENDDGNNYDVMKLLIDLSILTLYTVMLIMMFFVGWHITSFRPL